MKYPGTVLLTFFTFSCFSVAAQNVDSIPQPPRVRHEFGINATALLKQVFNLSNSTLPTLPYDLTYKYIYNTNAALRFGIGVAVDNTKLSRNLSTSPTPGPDDYTPTYSNSFSTYFRRFSFGTS